MKTKPSQRCYHFPCHESTRSIPEFFTQCSTHSGCSLYNNCFFRIGQSTHHFRCFVNFSKCTGRTNCHTLTTECTYRLYKVTVVCRCNYRVKTTVNSRKATNCLHIITHHFTTATKNTFIRITCNSRRISFT
ncbi:MAG: hypothetical protein BWY67_02124 [Bacteroidetes bacterium ADurb.Bin397]|nr:MAG: hypothetical protein BWY67_02124 [Bacteroidetes bacterium ADurb.Bin397]